MDQKNPIPFSKLGRHISYDRNDLDIPDSPSIIRLEAYKCKCRTIWCPECYLSIYYPKIRDQLMEFDLKNTVILTCTFDPYKCVLPGDPHQKSGKVTYRYIKNKAPISAYIGSLKRRKVKGKRPLMILGYMAVLEFDKNGNPHYHLVIHFADDAYKEHDLQRSWKHGVLDVKTFSRVGRRKRREYFENEYWQIFHYFYKDPVLYFEDAYQATPPKDWFNNYPKICRVLSSRNISLRQPRPNRERSPKKNRSSEDAGVKRPVKYNKSSKTCGKNTNFRVVFSNGYKAWYKLPLNFSDVRALPGDFVGNKAYLLKDPESIMELLGRLERRSKKKLG